METSAEPVEASFSIIESIRKHISQLKPISFKRGLICIGDYAQKIFMNHSFLDKTSSVLPIFIQKSSEENIKSAPLVTVQHDVLRLDGNVDTHFWFNVNSYLAENEEYVKRLRKSTNSLHEAIILVSLWEGLGSALLPNLISQYKALDANLVALAVIPSKAQPADSHFNALASIGMCASTSGAGVVLLSRDSVEDFVGVDRNGSRMSGNHVISYLLEMMLAKTTFLQELSELSRAFNVKLYTALLITGASLKVYGSFEKMLDAGSLNPFLPINLTTMSVLYVLVRVPLHLKETLSRGKIELETANWTKTITNIKSVFVSEPILVDDVSDRIDAVVLAGNFDLTELTAFLQKKAIRLKNESVKKGQIKEEEWESIVKSLTLDY